MTRDRMTTIKALLLDVDGVLIDGRPDDGRPWQTSLEEDFGFTSDGLHEHFFTPHWNEIVLGRADLLERLTSALRTIAPEVSAERFVSYWFAKDARVVDSFLPELARARSAGIAVYLATNQEHLRARYLMEQLGLAAHVDGIFYSAQLGAKKPDPEFFAKVQAALGYSAAELLLVDDSPANIDAALAAGWQALHWTKDRTPEVLRSFWT